MFGTVSEVISKLQTMQNQDEKVLVSLWHVEDVMEIRDNITKDQALRAMQLADLSHDSGVGINFDSLDEAVYEVRREDGCSE